MVGRRPYKDGRTVGRTETVRPTSDQSRKFIPQNKNGLSDTATTIQPVQTVELDPELLLRLFPAEENIVIVHCLHGRPDQYIGGARVWPQTCLIEEDGARRKLLKAFNIDLYPTWTPYDTWGPIRFTLVFEGLSKQCKEFHLLEDIPEPGGFYSDTVKRNGTDVYVVEVM